MTRRTFSLVVMLAAISVHLVPGLAAADTSDELIVSFQVPPAEAPQFVCVVTKDGCQQKAGEEDICHSRTLAQLTALQLLVKSDVSGDNETGFGAPPLKNPSTNATAVKPVPEKMVRAFKALAPPVTTLDTACDGKHSACTPKMSLALTQPGYSMTCDGESAGNGKVAILRLSIVRSKTAPLVRELQVVGSTVTLFFSKKVEDVYWFVDVIGGDYVPSNANGTSTLERASLELHPRCVVRTAQLPPLSALAPVAVKIERTPLTRTKAKPPAPVQCTPEGLTANAFAVQLPYSEGPERKTVTVELEPARNAGPTSGAKRTVLVAGWTTELPPERLDLAFTAIEIAWKRDCLAGHWIEPPPTAEAQWSGACPRATIPEAGVACTLEKDAPQPTESPGDPTIRANTEDDLCRYRCTASGAVPIHLPFKVDFERRRSREIEVKAGEPPRRSVESIYAWSDVVRYANQELQSFAPSNERQLLLEFIDTEQWVSRKGDRFEQLRVVLPDGTFTNIDLTSSRSEKPHSWLAVQAPGLTCGQRVRLAVFGSRKYNEDSRPVGHGQISLGSPTEFRNNYHGWFLVGVGAMLPVVSEHA